MTKALSAAAQRAIERRANHKLAVLRHVEEVSGNIATSCLYYGVSRQSASNHPRVHATNGFASLHVRTVPSGAASGSLLAGLSVCLAGLT